MLPFIIVVDVQEKTPFLFNHRDLKIEKKIDIEHAPLTTGDYSLKGFEDRVCVERKSLPDLFGSCGGRKGVRRDRFEREFNRMKEFEYAALVIEAGWDSIYKNPPSHSQILPKQILRTMVAWHMRYNVHVWPCPSRRFAEKTTYLLLDRFYRDEMKRIDEL